MGIFWGLNLSDSIIILKILWYIIFLLLILINITFDMIKTQFGLSGGMKLILLWRRQFEFKVRLSRKRVLGFLISDSVDGNVRNTRKFKKDLLPFSFMTFDWLLQLFFEILGFCCFLTLFNGPKNSNYHKVIYEKAFEFRKIKKIRIETSWTKKWKIFSTLFLP